MTRNLFSPSWHNVAPLKPQFVPQASVTRHVYRGVVWHVIQDPAGNKIHRLSGVAHEFVKRMDGLNTVQDIWDELCAGATAGSGDIPTQEEVVQLLMQLHGADLLRSDVTSDAARTLERWKKRRNQTWKQWLLNPMSLKLPLVNPDAFISALAPYLARVFSRTGAIVWLAVVLPALVLAGRHWGELTNNLSDQLLSGSNLIVMAAVFPVVKLLHELGHGFAAKVWGGRVHEMGLMLLVFAPAPYVDASSASAFESKYRRAVVGAAGMLTELFVAALAMYVWVVVEPGLARALAWNVMVVAGVSTLVINGNPLLRYDAYFILCDLIEMPNLAQRGQKYLTWLWNLKVYGVKDQEPPVESPSERRWLLLYTPVSWVYRVFITLSIALFVATQFFVFGVLLALWSLVQLVLVPLWKATRHVLRDPVLHRRRRQAVRMYFGLMAAVLAVALFIPVPARTQAQGVVWLPEQAILRAGGNGFFSRWLVEPGTRVARGTPVLMLDDPQLRAEAEIAAAKVAEAQARYTVEHIVNPVKAEIAKRQMEQEQALLDRAQQKLAKLVVEAEADGVLSAERAQDMPGRYYKKGELIGHVLDRSNLLARVVVQQDDIDLVRSRLRGASLRLADMLERVHATRVLREVPGGLNELPTSALSASNGGPVATDPQDSQGVKTLVRVFSFDMQLPDTVEVSAFGERVHVRFELTHEPMAAQLWRRARQTVLSHLAT